MQVVVTEQVLSVLPKDIQVWVRERKPKTCTEADQLAEDYLQARKMAPRAVEAGGETVSRVLPMWDCGPFGEGL